jgi:hypothetical protein
MKHLLLFFLLQLNLLVLAQGGKELGTGNEFKQFVADPASLSNQSLAFNKKQHGYFAYAAMLPGQPPHTPGPIVIKCDTGNGWYDLADLSYFGAGIKPIVTFDKFDTLHIAFFNQTGITVLKYRNTYWERMGFQDFPLGSSQVSDIVLKFDANNKPYIAGLTADSSIIIKSYDGWDWYTVHASGNLKLMGKEFDLGIPDGDTALYIAGFQNDYSGSRAASILRMRAPANIWDTLANEIFKDTSTTNPVDQIGCKIIFSNNGKLYLYLSYADSSSKVFSINQLLEWKEEASLPNNCFNFQMDKNGRFYAIQNEENQFSLISMQDQEWQKLGASSYHQWSHDFVYTFNDTIPYLVLNRPLLKPEMVKLSNDIWERAGGSTEGKVGFSDSSVFHLSIAVNPLNGFPYAVYTDAAAQMRTVVKAWNGTDWQNIGSDISSGSSKGNKIAIDNDGVPYVIFSDSAFGYKNVVKKFDGTSWVMLGNDAISANEALDNQLIITPDNKPAVLFIDAGLGNSIVMKTFESGNWQIFGSGNISTAAALKPQVVAADAGGFIVAYIDVTDNNKVKLKKSSNGGSWTDISANDASNEALIDIGLKRNTTGDLFMMMVDQPGRKMTIKKLENGGGEWIDMGGAKTKDSVGGSPSIGLDRVGTPIVAYPNPKAGNKLSIRKWDGTTWQNVGVMGISAGSVRDVHMVINDKNDETFIGYSSVQGFVRSFNNTNVSTKQLVGPDERSVLRVYPNPASSYFLISAPELFEQDIEIFDLYGKCVLKIAANRMQEVLINSAGFSNGIYLLKSGIHSSRLIISK